MMSMIGFIASPGFIMDFKDLKKIVNEAVIDKLDHQLVLSNDYLKENETIALQKNIAAWEAEPTAENMLIYIKTKFTESIARRHTINKITTF